MGQKWFAAYLIRWLLGGDDYEVSNFEAKSTSVDLHFCSSTIHEIRKQPTSRLLFTFTFSASFVTREMSHAPNKLSRRETIW